MRLTSLLFLLVTVILGSSYYHIKRTVLCVTPIYYQIGEFSKQFGISREQAKQAIEQAETRWEDLAGRELFVYKDGAKFTINFIFDERQATAYNQHNVEDKLNTVEFQNQKIRDEFKNLENTFLQSKEIYEKRVNTYNEDQKNLNQKIEIYNSSNEPNPAEEQALRQTQLSLEKELADLSQEATRLEQLSRQLNTLVERGNVMVDVYNQTVQSYNIRFGQAREFTQGDYQGDRINIYTFLDDNELIRVLVHEFGHALGIGHVENESSMMYHLMGEQPTKANLSAEDQTAFFATCGQEIGLRNRLLTTVNKFLILN